MSKETWISSNLKNQHQVKLHRQTDTSWQVSVISDRQPKATKKWHQIFSFNFLNNLLMSYKELIWFYTAKIDGYTPARSCPLALQACKSISSSHQALAFPGEQLRAVEGKQSHSSNFPPSVLTVPLSLKWDRKPAAHPSAALPAPCGTGVIPHWGKSGCPLALTVTTEEQHSETKPTGWHVAKPCCSFHFLFR